MYIFMGFIGLQKGLVPIKIEKPSETSPSSSLESWAQAESMTENPPVYL